MAKYVLVSFDDDTDADNFVAALQRHADPEAEGRNSHVFYTTKHPTLENHFSMRGVLEASVRAVWKKPTQFCECANPGEKSARGQKWGWWVHKDCGKAKKGNFQSPRNLLDPPGQRARDIQIFLNVVEPQGPPAYLKEA